MFQIGTAPYPSPRVYTPMLASGTISAHDPKVEYRAMDSHQKSGD